MPLDPSIISSYNPTPGIDVNALMQQRMQGMANINAMERQRQADALALEDRAAEQQKAQEAEAIKALLPAYTYGIETGDMTGALNLVPTEMRGQLQPYVQALEGKSPDQVRSALIGSLSSSPVGQEALAAIQRSQTAKIQMGQLDVSRGNLALDRQKAALDAKGEGEWELKEGEDGFFWTNPRTRQVVPAAVTGEAPAAAVPVPGAVAAPGVVTPRAPAPGAPVAEAPISTQQPPATFRPKPKAGGDKDFTEREGKSVNFAVRMIDSDNIANELEKEGVLTTDAVTDAVIGAVRALPTIAGGNLSEQIQNALNVVSPTLSAEEQRLAVAQLDFITAVLRSESGAEIKASEFPAEYRKYFPVEGDENNPKLIADKKRRRQNAIAGMKAQAGKRGAEDIDLISKSSGVSAAPAEAPVPAAPGTSLEGFTFRGERKGQ